MAFDFKKTWGSITESAKKTAGDISEKTKIMAEKSKLKSKMNTEENNINKKYLDLGKLAYEMAKKQNIVIEEFDEFVKDIDLGVSEIEKLKREMEKLDGCVFCSNCGASMPVGTEFCSKCGTKYVAPPSDDDEISDAPEDVKEEKNFIPNETTTTEEKSEDGNSFE